MTRASRRTAGRWCREPNWSWCSTMYLECSPDSTVGKWKVIKVMTIAQAKFHLVGISIDEMPDHREKRVVRSR